MSPSRLPNDAVCIYSHSSVGTTKSASVRMQFGYVIPIPANSCQCAKSVERRYTLVMHGVCEMSSSLHTITLSTRLSPTGHRGQLINLTCRVFHGNCEECISAFKPLNRTRNLRSLDDDQLVVPRVMTVILSLFQILQYVIFFIAVL